MNKASLALMAKIHQLYEGKLDGSFLSYLPVAQTYIADDFTFSAQGSVGVADALEAEADFASLVNMLPTVEQFAQPRSDARVWTVVDEVLKQAQVAESTLSAAEQTRLAQARALLTESFADYQNYADQHLQLSIERNNLKIEIEQSGTVATNEQKTRLEELETRLQMLERAWKIVGKKEAVESAIAMVDQLEGASPIQRWDEMKLRFNTAVKSDLKTHREFRATSFLPRNFHEPNGSGWAQISLTRQEVENLYQLARTTIFKDYPNLFSREEDAIEIESLQARLGTITVERPWLEGNMFESRYWNLPSYLQPLSDGQPKPKGQMPAYITQLLFIRDLKIQLKENSAVNQQTFDKIIKAKTLLNFGTIQLPVPPVNPLEVKQLSYPVFLDRSAASGLRVIQREQIIRPNVANLHTGAIKTATLNSAVFLNPAITTVNPAVVSAVKPGRVSINPTVATKISPMVKGRGVEPAPGNSFLLYGFICRKLPRCPNPEANLDWI